MANDIRIEAHTSPLRLISQGGDQTIRLRLSVQAGDELRSAMPSSPASEEAGADICLVLDVSGTMRYVLPGEVRGTGQFIDVEGVQAEVVEGGTTKLQACVAAALPLIGLLRPQDTLSLVTFSDEAQVICERLGPDQAGLYRAALEGLYAGGLTSLGKGIRLAADVLSRGRPERAKKIILLTDGNPEGEDASAALAAGQEAANRSITLDCLGFGTDFNFVYMQQVVTPSRGRSDLLSNQKDAEELFSSWLRKAQDVVATNLRLRIVFSDKVRVSDHYRGAPENMYLGKVRLADAAREYTLPLGVLERNQRYDYFFLVTVSPPLGYTGDIRLMKAELTYDIPSQGKAAERTDRNVVITFVADAEQARARDSEVETNFTRVEIKRLERERDEALQRNDQATVVARCMSIIDRWKSLGDALEARKVQELLEEYRRTGKLSQEKINEGARSSSKPGDAGLLSKKLPAEKEAAILGKKRTSTAKKKERQPRRED